MTDLEPGKLLISNPFLKDPNFIRSVILICEKDEGGTLGFILNKRFEQSLNELVSLETNQDFPVYYGGPVSTNSLYFLHNRPDVISASTPIGENVFWGGDFEETISNINNGVINFHQIKFFVGYSGWSNGQLEEEVEEGSWMVEKMQPFNLFESNENSLWKDVLVRMGGNYKIMANYPLDPTLN
jgi:putative transcriptional regulator